MVRFFLKLAEYGAARFADGIIVVSENLHSYFCEKYKRDTLLLPNGADVVNYQSPRLMKDWGLSKNGYILYIGRLSREKGVDCLLDAYGQVDTNKKMVALSGSVSMNTRLVAKHYTIRSAPSAMSLTWQVLTMWHWVLTSMAQQKH